VPDAHGHGHGHSHDASDADPEDTEGPEIRAARDEPGRHGKGVYGTPAYAKDAVPEAPVRPRGVPSGQGGRSFGLGRKRAL
jgi:hypothetical protein